MEQNQFQNGEKKSVASKVGDAIEHVGQKVTQAGATNVGDAIYKAGDKLEHSNEENENDPAIDQKY